MTDFVNANATVDEAARDPYSAESLLGPEVWKKLESLENTTTALALGTRITEVKENLPIYEDLEKGASKHVVITVGPEDAASADALLLCVSALQDDQQTLVQNAETCRIFLRKATQPEAGVTEAEVATAQRFDLRWSPADGFTRDGERYLKVPLGRAAAGGLFYVTLEHMGAHEAPMSVKVAYSYVKRPEAVDVGPNTVTRGENGASEMTYYRFVNLQPEALVTIHVRPVFEETTGEPIGDPDLYVSNVADGLAVLDRERYVWKSCNVGADRVDIHPGDSSVRMSNTFLIGILGYKERNVFEVEIKITPPHPITDLQIGAAVEFQASTTRYTYFKLRVDPERRSQVRLTLYARDDADGLDGADDDGTNDDALDSSGEQDLVQTFGRGIYTMDMSKVRLTRDELAAIRDDYRPIMFVSCCVMYPTADDTSMRAIAPRGPAAALLECDEWRYNGDFCFIGVKLQPWMLTDPFAAEDAGEVHVPEADRPCKLVVSEREEMKSLPRSLRAPFQVWEDLFGDIDGGSVSQKDRSELDAHGDSSFTYGEVEFVSFSKLLAACDVQPGETFLDLGSGTGKAVFIAAFGGHGFGRCVGIELLPGLHDAAEETAARILGPDGDRARSLLNVDLPEIRFVQGDMTAVDWSYADVVYTSSICFTDELIEKIGEGARSLKRGARFCTLKTWPDAEDYFETISSTWYKMSWGRICVYVLQRR